MDQIYMELQATLNRKNKLEIKEQSWRVLALHDCRTFYTATVINTR